MNINDENGKNTYGFDVHNLNTFDLDVIRQEQIVGELIRLSEARFDQHGGDREFEPCDRHLDGGFGFSGREDCRNGKEL